MHKHQPGRSCLAFLLFHLMVCFTIPSTKAIIVEEVHPFERTPSSPSGKLVKGPDGSYYGTSSSGGQYSYGTIFRLTPEGELTTLYSFGASGSPLGDTPHSGLTLGSDGNLYGSTAYGYPNSSGSIFQLTTNGTVTAIWSSNVYHSFQTSLVLAPDGNFYGVDGINVLKYSTNGTLTWLADIEHGTYLDASPSLIAGSDGNLYGTTSVGGLTDRGTIFRVTLQGNYTRLYSFSGPDGTSPRAELIQGKDGGFYGTTFSGGAYNSGTVFKYSTNGILTTLLSFAGTNGNHPRGSLVQAPDGGFYGTTAEGGLQDGGTVFKISPSGALTTLASFVATNGIYPIGCNPTGLYLEDDGNLLGVNSSGGRMYYGSIFRLAPDGSTSIVADFHNETGSNPYNTVLIKSVNGNIYGTAPGGGRYFGGTIFKMDPTGQVTTLHHFQGEEGIAPVAGLLEASDGNLYGATSGIWVGTNHNRYGALFRCDTNGTVTPLIVFDGANGRTPTTTLVQGQDGFIYGTTTETGSSNKISTIFKLSTNGAFSSLISFDSSVGLAPNSLAVGTNGFLFGTTASGGISNYGSIFRVSTNGVLASLIQLTALTGGKSVAPLTLSPDGNFYGITSYGGANDSGTFFKLDHDGNLSIISHLPSIYRSIDKYGLVIGRDGNFYGFFTGGGREDDGRFVKISPSGDVSELYNFAFRVCRWPISRPLLVDSGNSPTFYAATYEYGSKGAGSLIRLYEPSLIFTAVGNSDLTLSWPAAATNYTLQSATSLNSPTWTALNVTPTAIGQTNSVVLPKEAGTKFFRLSQ